jgi:hypothetical protein
VIHTMPIEATEHTGPIVIWRKELRPDSGGDGEFRGGLGQIIEIAPRRAMSSISRRCSTASTIPPAGAGGRDGAPASAKLDDGTTDAAQGLAACAGRRRLDAGATRWRRLRRPGQARAGSAERSTVNEAMFRRTANDLHRLAPVGGEAIGIDGGLHGRQGAAGDGRRRDRPRPRRTGFPDAPHIVEAAHAAAGGPDALYRRRRHAGSCARRSPTSSGARTASTTPQTTSSSPMAPSRSSSMR